jgi:hypothetical protein
LDRRELRKVVIARALVVDELAPKSRSSDCVKRELDFAGPNPAFATSLTRKTLAVRAYCGRSLFARWRSARRSAMSWLRGGAAGSPVR